MQKCCHSVAAKFSQPGTLPQPHPLSAPFSKRKYRRTIQSFWLAAVAAVAADAVFHFYHSFWMSFIMPFWRTLPIYVYIYSYICICLYTYVLLLSAHKTFCLFPQMQFAAARPHFSTFFIVCHFLLILHYIKHGIAIMYDRQSGQTCVRTRKKKNNKKRRAYNKKVKLSLQFCLGFVVAPPHRSGSLLQGIF